MAECEPLHRAYDKLANGPVQVGDLPTWTRVRGKVAWYVYAGPYRELGEKGWDAFWSKLRAANLAVRGAPGDLYVCPPHAHAQDREASMLTILWAPVE